MYFNKIPRDHLPHTPTKRYCLPRCGAAHRPLQHSSDVLKKNTDNNKIIKCNWEFDVFFYFKQKVKMKQKLLQCFLPCKSTFNRYRTVVCSALVSMRHSNTAPRSLRCNDFRSVAFSVNKPFASGPSLVDIDSSEETKK